MIKTSHSLALKGIDLTLLDEEVKSSDEGLNQDAIVFNSDSIQVFNICSFPDRSDVAPTGINSTSNNIVDLICCFFNDFVDITDDSSPYAGYETIKDATYSVSKAMLVALLDGDSKRTGTISTSTLQEKKEIFYNVLSDYFYESASDTRNYSIKPWNNWYDTQSTITPSIISRNNNIAIVTFSSPHGLSTSFDDWSAIINLNTPGIATYFNISTSVYPNGVPIKIIDENTFSYRNVGSSSTAISVTGSVDIRVGFGGKSNNLHTVCTFPG